MKFIFCCFRRLVLETVSEAIAPLTLNRSKKCLLLLYFLTRYIISLRSPCTKASSEVSSQA